MDEFVCVAVLGMPGETPSQLQSRLYAFWTHMLRNKPEDYEKVYAESTEFETVSGGRVSRRYMVQPDGLATLLAELKSLGFDNEPVDEADLYSKAEASSSEWFQLEH